MFQRATTIIFKEMLEDTVECYVNDLVFKSRGRINHLKHLKTIFNKLCQHKLKMNPLKYVFGVTFGKFLGFLVCHRGIKVDPAKGDQRIPSSDKHKETQMISR